MKEVKKCYNCRFASESFKIDTMTHYHCLNTEKYPEKDMKAGKISPFETLVEFWYSCAKWQPKTKTHK